MALQIKPIFGLISFICLLALLLLAIYISISFYYLLASNLLGITQQFLLFLLWPIVFSFFFFFFFWINNNLFQKGKTQQKSFQIMTFKPLFGPITILFSSFVTFRVSRFPVSYLTHETVKLCLQNTLNMSKTARVYFGVLHSITWSPDPFGAFTVSSTWNHFRHRMPVVNLYHTIWFPQAIRRHSFIVWLVIQDRLATQDKLLKWGLTNSDSCVFCRASVEDRNHLFFCCHFTAGTWIRIFRLCGNSRMSRTWENSH